MKSLTSLPIFLRTTSSSTSASYFLFYQCPFLHRRNNSKPETKTVRISQLSFSSSSSSSFSSSSRRQSEEESRTVKISVWWDFENCNLPVGVNGFKVANNITAALRTNGIKGPVTITAFGDVLQLSRSKQEALSSTGISLNHVPSGGKNSSDRSLLVDLVYWVSQNPPPAHLFLISGDRDFANILHRLRMNNYNILLASNEAAPEVLCSAASIMWHWSALVRGDNLTGDHFNQPPDGPYNSWYGHYKGPLKDPYSNLERQPSLRPEELLESGTDSKVRVIPKTVVKQICQILNSYPKGIAIRELWLELGKSNITLDKDCYGHKRFSRMLLAMPTVLKLEPTGDGMLVVHGTPMKGDKSVESTSETGRDPESNNVDQNFTENAELNRKDHTVAHDENVKSSSSQVSSSKVEEHSSNGHKETDFQVAMPHSNAVVEKVSTSEISFFQRMWRKWFGLRHGDSNVNGNSVAEKYSASDDNTVKEKSQDKCVESIGHFPRISSSHSSSSTNVDKLVMDEKAAKSYEENGDKSKSRTGFFNAILNWCQFWVSTTSSNNTSKQCSEEPNQKISHSLSHELFSKNSFWNDVESFMNTPKGTMLVCRSRTREQLAQNLLKEGPLILSSFTETDLLHLVDLIISEKKWLEECPSQTFPFKLTGLTKTRSSSTRPSRSNDLSSIFLVKASKSKSGRRPENEGETEACLLESNKRHSDKSRREILAHCQKLVADTLKEHPEGFNMGIFKQLFIERYGYPLDLQKLGYQRLATLLQTMQGVRIESSYIVPAGKPPKNSSLYIPENKGTEIGSNSYVELSTISRKDDDCDSVWEELGPVSETSSARKNVESMLDWKTSQKVRGQVDFDDASLSDEEFSESEEKCPTSNASERQGRSKKSEEESSLLQILDSWYNSKDDNGNMGQSHNDLVGCSRNDSIPSDSSGIGVRSEPHSINSTQKSKPLKKYSFVSDPDADDKDKMIDNILGSLKKSAESKIQG